MIFTTEKCEIVIRFPLYNNVSELFIGLQDEASFETATPYKYDKKVLCYGSSITQGACVSRPGFAYPNQLSMLLGFDFVNLGCSASAKGELFMTEWRQKLHHFS